MNNQDKTKDFAQIYKEADLAEEKQMKYIHEHSKELSFLKKTNPKEYYRAIRQSSRI